MARGDRTPKQQVTRRKAQAKQVTDRRAKDKAQDKTKHDGLYPQAQNESRWK